MAYFGMVGFSDLLDDGLESIVIVCGVLDNADCAIGLIQTVFALHNIAVTNFPLTFVVTGVGVFDSIFEFVLWVCVMFVMMLWLVMFIAVMLWNLWNNWCMMVMNWIVIVVDFNAVSVRCNNSC